MKCNIKTIKSSKQTVKCQSKEIKINRDVPKTSRDKCIQISALTKDNAIQKLPLYDLVYSLMMVKARRERSTRHNYICSN